MENVKEYVDILAYVVAAASIVANLTKTETDNKIVGYVSGVVNFLALNWKKK